MRNFDFKRYTPRPKKLLRASLRERPCKNGQGFFRTFADFPDFFSESRQLYHSNKYHIYLDQFDILYFLRGDFQSHLKTTQFAIGDSVNLP